MGGSSGWAAARVALQISRSLVEGEHPVAHAGPPGDHVRDTPETSVVLGCPFEHVLVSAVAEWCICTELAIAEFVVSALRDIKVDRSAPGDNPLALAVSEWTDL